MNTEMLTNLLNTYLFLRRIALGEYQLRETCCNETQLDEPIDAFPRFQTIGIEAEVLFDIPKNCFYLPPLSIVFDDLRDLKRQVCCKDAEIPIRFSRFRTVADDDDPNFRVTHFRPHNF